MESFAEVGFSIMQRFKLLEEALTSKTDDSKSQELPKHLFLAQHDRFELWAVNLGVFVMGHGSLDYRIRDSESMRGAIWKMVTDLNRSLDEALEYLNGDLEQGDEDSGMESDIESEIDTEAELLLDSIRDPIDRLYKMAVWIRNPATRIPSSKARNFQQIDEETQVDLFKSFEDFDHDYISSLFLQYEKDKALQENPTVRYQGEVDDIDGQDQVWEPVRTVLKLNRVRIANATESYLVRRIVQANGRRRQQFAYWRSHKDKLRKHSAVAVAAPALELPNISHQIGLGNRYSAKAPLTVTTATQLRPLSGEEKESCEKANALNHVVSEYAPSAWEPSKDRVCFPPPPRVPATEQFFECPYCYTICPASLLSEKAWRAHLIRDLRPYVCTFQYCSSSDQLYDSRDDWIEHEVSTHQTIFRCPRHQDDTFRTSEAYERHIQEHCQGETLSLSLAKSTTTNIQRSCPVCSIVLQSTQKLQSHIALHLERFALFTLPRYTDDTEGDELEMGSTRAPMESDISLDGHDVAMPVGMADQAGRGMGPNQQAMGMPGGPKRPALSLEMARLNPADRTKVNELATKLMNQATEQQRNSTRLHFQSKLSAEQLAEFHSQAKDPLLWWYQYQSLSALKQVSLHNSFIKLSGEIRPLKQSLEDVFATSPSTHEHHFFAMLARLQSRLKILHGKLDEIWSLKNVLKSTSHEDFENHRRSFTLELGELCITAGLLGEAIECFEHLKYSQASQLSDDPESIRTLHQMALVYEVNDALGPEADLRTELGKSMALERLAWTALGAHHAETIWGPSIRKEISKIMADHGTAVKGTGTEERTHAAAQMKQVSEHGQESTGSEAIISRSEDPLETGDASTSSKEIAGTPRSDAVLAEGQQRCNSLAEGDQTPPVPQGGNKDGEWLTATPRQRLGKLDTDHEGAASDAMSSTGEDAQDGMVREDRASRKPNRDEYSQPDMSADFGKFSDWLNAEGEGVSFTPTNNPDKQDTQANQQIQEDSEMEEEREQVEREMQVFRHIYHPLWVAAQLERQLEAKATDTQDKEGKLIAHQLEMDLRTYRDDVGKLENQFLTEARKQERSEKVQVLTTKIRSFNWKAVEKRLEEIRVGRRARLEATRGLSTRLDESTPEREEARQDQETQEAQANDTQMADSEAGLTREPRQIRIVERGGEGKRALSASPPRRPRPVANHRREGYQGSTSRGLGLKRANYWRCCKCAGGWYRYEMDDTCPMCQSWRCSNCEYSMS